MLTARLHSGSWGKQRNLLEDQNETNTAASPGQLTVFPNPTAGQLSLLLGDFEVDEAIEINVQNALGATVHTVRVAASAQPVELDLQHLQPGIYLLEGRQASMVKTARIVLDR